MFIKKKNWKLYLQWANARAGINATIGISGSAIAQNENVTACLTALLKRISKYCVNCKQKLN